MGKTVAIGIQDFSTIRQRDCFYIDKTSFIKEWWESGDDTTLITRPRRFGKTLNMSMLACFFSLEYAKRSELFEGLSIWQEEKYRRLQGTYPVISLSFANVKEKTFENAREKIEEILAQLYKDHRYILESDTLTTYDKKQFLQAMKGEMSTVKATLALQRLSGYLKDYYGKQVIILLDEYDTPMQEAYVHGYWEEASDFMRSLFHAAFKTNPYLERALMTGITRVGRESVFSDLNHLKVITTTSRKYHTAFGFTQEEVFSAMETYGLGEKKEKVKYWYDGFVFGNNTDMYNPWSILNFLATGDIQVYWANTSSNSLISKLLRESSRQMKMSFERLLKGETIACAVDEQIVYSWLEENEEAVYSLFIASGYLKVQSCHFTRDLTWEEEDTIYELAITNNEVKKMFRGLIKDWFATARADYNDFIKALLKGDVKAMNNYFNRILLQTFSYFDTKKGTKGQESERFYHGFVLGLLVELSGKYVITSNRESGFGRYDVMLTPKNNTEDAYILEFKTYDGQEEEGLQDTLQAALRQIQEKKYEAALMAEHIPPERIHKYGFAFQGKKVLIGGQ